MRVDKIRKVEPTYLDKPPKEMEEREQKRRFKDILDLLATSCSK